MFVSDRLSWYVLKRAIWLCMNLLIRLHVYSYIYTLHYPTFVLTGKRTQYNALKDRPTSWDPYGVAKVNMSDFMLGQKVINIQIPVHSCSIPDILGRQAETGRVGASCNFGREVFHCQLVFYTNSWSAKEFELCVKLTIWLLS